MEQQPCGCVSNPRGGGGGGHLSYHSECFKIAANELTVKRVHTLDNQLILGLANLPPNLDFQASTFGSSAVVTQKCGSHFIGRDEFNDAERDIVWLGHNHGQAQFDKAGPLLRGDEQ